METQIWLCCLDKFIYAENITLLSASSDDFLHALLEVAEQLHSYVRKKVKFPGEDRGGSKY